MDSMKEAESIGTVPAEMEMDPDYRKIMGRIIRIVGRGNNVEIRRRKDGKLSVFEVKKTLWDD